jgi:hypothetical protein
MDTTVYGLPWVPDDGGREAAGFKGSAGDCVARAIAIATVQRYRDVYKALAQLNAEAPLTRRQRAAGKVRARSARNGVDRRAIHRYMEDVCGWAWHPTMAIGSGCRVHLADGEIPATGRFVVQVSKHVTAVIDGVLYDTHDPCRDGTRCVYGYWTEPGIPG